MARLCQQVGVLAQPVAGALDLHDHGVVQQSVEQCRGHDRIAKNFTPFGKAAVRGEDHGALFVAGVDQLEEQIAGAGPTLRYPISSDTNAYAVLADTQWRGYRPPLEAPGPVAGTWG